MPIFGGASERGERYERNVRKHGEIYEEEKVDDEKSKMMVFRKGGGRRKVNERRIKLKKRKNLSI
jgi:hypothetical protein